MRTRPLFLLSALLVTGWLFAVGVAGAAMPNRVPLPQAPPVPGAGLLHKVDTFAECQRIRWCGHDRYGRYRCRPVIRCRECKYVRRCGGPLGCRWSEVCRWGPYKPPLPTN